MTYAHCHATPVKDSGMCPAPHERHQIERLAEAPGTIMKEVILRAVSRQLDGLDEPLRARPGSVLEGLENAGGSAGGPRTLAPTKIT
jgi:hypothetical protein